jgi:cysteine desulfurase
MRQAAMAAYLEADVPGNPHALHRPARRARQVLDEARDLIAREVGAVSAEVVFTSGGTEADALAVRGVYVARQEPARPYLLVGATEHHAVLDNARLLGGTAGGDMGATSGDTRTTGWPAGRPADQISAATGGAAGGDAGATGRIDAGDGASMAVARVVAIPVDRSGRADLDFVAQHLRQHGSQTALISLMAANNETGAIQPVAELVELAAEYGVPVHSDWVQAAGKTGLDFGGSGLAAASLSAHKLGGPVGMGALLVARHVAVKPLVGGGGQERGIRSGTVDVRGAAAFAAALAEAGREDPGRLEALLSPLDAFIQAHSALTALTPAGRHLPGLRNFTVAGARGETLVYLLDQAGFACSTGSACTAGVARPSHVLAAMGLDEAEASSAVRVSVGHLSTAGHIEALVRALPEVIERAQAAGRVTVSGSGSAVGRVTADGLGSAAGRPAGAGTGPATGRVAASGSTSAVGRVAASGTGPAAGQGPGRVVGR